MLFKGVAAAGLGVAPSLTIQSFIDMSYAKDVAEKTMGLSTAAEVSEYLREALPEELRDFL